MPLSKRNIDDSTQTGVSLTPLTSTDADLPGASIPLALNTTPPGPGVVTIATLVEYLQAAIASSVVGDTWLTSAAIVDGDLLESGSLEWTVAADAPTGVADGENTKCTIPLLPPDTATFGWRVALYDSSDTVVDVVMGMWRSASEDIDYFLKLDSTSYVTFRLEDIGTDTLVPTFTFSIENTDNGLTGYYITISAASLSI